MLIGRKIIKEKLVEFYESGDMSITPIVNGEEQLTVWFKDEELTNLLEALKSFKEQRLGTIQT